MGLAALKVASSDTPAAGEGRRRAAGHRPSAELVEAVEGGNPRRTVLVVRQAGAAAAASHPASKTHGAAANELKFGARCWRSVLQSKFLEDRHVARMPQNRCCFTVDTLALIILLATCSEPEKPQFHHWTNSKGSDDFRRACSFASWRDASVLIDFDDLNGNWWEDVYV